MFLSSYSRFSIFSVLTLIAISCAPRESSTPIVEQISLGVHLNETAQTEADWASSGFTPKDVFSEKNIDSEKKLNELCQALLELSDDKLTLYEDQIDASPVGLKLPCRDQLQGRLNSFWNHFEDKLATVRKDLGLHPIEPEPLVLVTPLPAPEPTVTPSPVPQPTPILLPVSPPAQLPETNIPQAKKIQTEIREISVAGGRVFGYGSKDDALVKGEVVLTFDDGPHMSVPSEGQNIPESFRYQFEDRTFFSRSAAIQRALEDRGLLAQYFVVGQSLSGNSTTVRAREAYLKYMAQAGHSIGSHSFSHPDMKKLSFENASAEISRAQNIIERLLNKDAMPFFRFPFGNKTSALQQWLSNENYATFFWDVDSNDWRYASAKDPDVAGEDMMTKMFKELDARNRGIILFHDTQKLTSIVLPTVLDRLEQKGYRTVILRSTPVIP